jgi:predicted ABC-type ATPase
MTEMRYLARDFAMHLERPKMRADAGGHSAPESVLRPIYEASIPERLASDSRDGFPLRL